MLDWCAVWSHEGGGGNYWAANVVEVVEEGVGEQSILAKELDAPAWLSEVDLSLLVGRTGARAGARARREGGG